MRKPLLLATALLFSLSAHAAPEVCDKFAATGLDELAVKTFRDKLFTALKAGDAKAVAAMVQFPLKAWKTEKQFLKAYGKTFSADFVQKVVSAPVADAVCRDQGVGLANGAIWLNAPDAKKPSDIKIIAINR